ncbi:MAG: T9SS type A sorting domain-containing protein [Bacteroidota bacterium]
MGCSNLFGRENIGQKRASNKGLRTTASCAPASSSVELDVNNVRALLHNGGDFWWDLVGNPRYEVPKLPPDQAASARHSSFAGSLWIGGVDESGQLRVAAQTYRQSGNDFWPGPLTSGGAAVDDVTCEQWDQHYKITKAEITAFRAAYQSALVSGQPLNIDDYPNVKNWPAFGEDSEGNRIELAPFVDVDFDPFNYSPEAGDYPDIAPTAGGGEPDQAIWWVINDKGDIHTETGGEAIGVEIQMLAFGFSTSNAINDMTFYKYKVINKSTLKLNETYMGQWVDADIGNFSDDYVGCDTARGLGFAYNGDPNDETAAGYGTNPPALGVDFFQGPFGDNGQRLPMQYFVYYENDFSLRGNPEVATHYYGYLRGFWKDGSRMVNNGTNGFPASGSGPVTNYMYPGDPGWCGGGGNGGWSEVSASNSPFDRRFIQSAGPFTLQPGAVNDIVTGAVWARAFTNDNLGSVCELLTADDIAQALFNANFELLDGPDAPELAIEEYDKELLVSWDYSNATLFNNFNETYLQADPVLIAEDVADSLFEFEGYILYQLKDATVSASDLFDTEKARILTQCDIKNDVSTIVNRAEATVPGLTDPVIVDEVMVQGANDGIFRSFRATEDLFTETGDRSLKNYTTYYYGILAYAYNDTSSDGRKFVQGNRFFANTAAMPHPIDFENFGTVTNSAYGDGIQLTQTAGVGNGGNFVEITDATRDAIFNADSVGEITYVAGAAPVDVKVVNPKEVIPGNYRLELVEDEFEGTAAVVRSDSVDIVDSTFVEWRLFESNNVIFESTYIKRTKTEGTNSTVTFRPQPFTGTERVIEGHGISVAVENVIEAGDTLIDGFLGATLTYADPLQDWLVSLGDNDGFETWNWIQAGDENGDRGHIGGVWKSNRVFDKEEHFEEILGGGWAPFCLARGFSNNDPDGKVSPGVEDNASQSAGGLAPGQFVNLSSLPDIDIVITPNTEKWSKCVVVETSSGQNLGSGAWPMSARWDYPVRQPGQEKDTNGDLDQLTDYGFSYFPGYAIDVNTGRRLNIFFGEASWDKLNNGDDMLWNPTSDFGPAGQRVGGRHYIYISETTYDECQSFYNFLSNANFVPSGSQTTLLYLDTQDSTTDMRNVYSRIAWVGAPLLSQNFDFTDPTQIPTETTIKLRVNQPFRSRGGTEDYSIFNFSTEDIAAMIGQKETAERSLMEDIRIVPNPYYAYSKYERSQVQTIVKLTNLPQQCKIKIFTLNGTLIRTYTKDSELPEQQWDLKNQDGVPVASGVYIIHVDAGELGEKVVKFFAVMPQIDLNAF